MSEQPLPQNRASDQAPLAQAQLAVQKTSKTFWAWVERHHVDALLVLAFTLGITLRVMDWAFEYSYEQVLGISGAERAAIIAAVLGPWGLMQGAMVKWYMELKAKPKDAAGG